MSGTSTPSKLSRPVLLRLESDEREQLVVRAAEIQAAEKQTVSVQDVIRRTLFPDRYPPRAAA